MAYTETNIPLEAIREIQTGNGTLIQAVIGDIMRNVPVGFAHHKLGDALLYYGPCAGRAEPV